MAVLGCRSLVLVIIIIIRKDRSLGGGGVFIRFRDNLNISEVSELTTEDEIIWAKLSTPKQKQFYLCSLYRTPNNIPSLILSLRESLPNGLYYYVVILTYPVSHG